MQGAFWIVSYALYLIYTGPYVVYDLLPVVFPGITPYRPVLVVLLALLIAASLLGTLILTLWIVAAIAALQLAVTVALAAVSLAHLGVPVAAFAGHGDFPAVLQGTAGVSLLYVCASLPLFLGGEVRGGPSAIRRGIGWGFSAVAALVVLASLPMARASRSVMEAPIPGVALAGALAGRGFATAVGIAVAVSAAGLILAELIALSRLLSAVFQQPGERMVRVIAAGLVAASLITLVDPGRVYSLLLRPSLIALWISQLLVVGVYPWFIARSRRLRAADVGLAAAASALMGYGLYTAAVSPLGP